MLTRNEEGKKRQRERDGERERREREMRIDNNLISTTTVKIHINGKAKRHVCVGGVCGKSKKGNKKGMHTLSCVQGAKIRKKHKKQRLHKQTKTGQTDNKQTDRSTNCVCMAWWRMCAKAGKGK